VTSTTDLMLAILALDSYDRGNDPLLNVSGNQVGDATILPVRQPANEESVGFYASAYDWNGEVVISYRGTNLDYFAQDLSNGFSVAVGSAFGPQALDAIQFFQTAAEYDDPTIDGDWQAADVAVTGHSLGGGLAGFVGAIYGLSGDLFDNMTFDNAAEAAYQAAIKVTFNSDGTVSPADPAFAQMIYGSQAPYPNDFSGLSAIATTGEVLEELLPARFFQTPPVNYLSSYARTGANPVSLHSMALLVLLMYADENQLTDWDSAGPVLYKAEFDDALGKAVGFVQSNNGGGTGSASPSALAGRRPYVRRRGGRSSHRSVDAYAKIRRNLSADFAEAHIARSRDLLFLSKARRRAA
jgi:hypothetical protein